MSDVRVRTEFDDAAGRRRPRRHNQAACRSGNISQSKTIAGAGRAVRPFSSAQAVAAICR